MLPLDSPFFLSCGQETLKTFWRNILLRHSRIFYQVWRSIVKQSLFHHRHKPLGDFGVVVAGHYYGLASVEFEDCIHIVLRKFEVKDVQVFCRKRKLLYRY